MILITNTTEFQIEEATAVAIGKFDGLHRGHRMLLDKLMAARKLGLKTAIFTFDPSPTVFFTKEPVKELMTREEKRACFEEMGVDYLVEYPFSAKTAAVSPESYVKDFLIKKMNARYIVAGEDVSFGDKGRGDAQLLCELAKENGAEVRIISKLCHNGREISSTYVRSEVINGNMELVTELIGEPFFVSGTVLQGNRIGRTIGMPTVNLIPNEQKILPPNGVYFSTVDVQGSTYFGVTNVGTKPTVKEEKKVIGVETFIFDFSDDVYGKEIKVNLHCFDRPEQTFSGLDELKKAIQLNVTRAREYFHMDVSMN